MNVNYQYAHSLRPEDPSVSRRRPHAVQPLNLLTTTLGNTHNAGLGIGGQTPVSTTSLSSPFSQHQPSPYPRSPAGAMRGTSPSVHRTPFSTAYNPQQWGPLNATSSPSPNSASASMGPRHPSQTTRVALLAARPVGPDGMIGC